MSDYWNFQCIVTPAQRKLVVALAKVYKWKLGLTDDYGHKNE